MQRSHIVIDVMVPRGAAAGDVLGLTTQRYTPAAGSIVSKVITADLQFITVPEGFTAGMVFEARASCYIGAGWSKPRVLDYLLIRMPERPTADMLQPTKRYLLAA